jgi:putative transcriptional regulator
MSPATIRLGSLPRLRCFTLVIQQGGERMNQEQLENARINLKKWREEKNWSQEKVAELMEISVRHYYHLESGTRNINMVMATKISEVFEVTFNDIFLK